MSTTPPPPGYAPADPTYAPGFVEPTRRLPFAPPFDYSGRYGASLVAVVLGGYLLANTNAGQLATAFLGVGQDPLVIVLFVTQLIFAVLVVVVGFLIAPATLSRRLIAAAVVVAVVLIWFLVLVGRLTGSLPLTRDTGQVFLVLNSVSMMVPLATATGWLIVRERPGISYLLLITTIIGGLIPFAMVFGGAPSVATIMVGNVLSLVIGVGIAWGARGFATLFSRRVGA